MHRDAGRTREDWRVEGGLRKLRPGVVDGICGGVRPGHDGLGVLPAPVATGTRWLQARWPTAPVSGLLGPGSPVRGGEDCGDPVPMLHRVEL